MNIFTSFPTLSSSLQMFGLTLFHSLWQGIIIGIICWLMLRMMHRKMASLRFAVAYIALLLLFFTFAATFYMQYHASSTHSQEFAFADIASDKRMIPSTNTVSLQEDWWTSVTAFYQTLTQKLIAYAPLTATCWLLGFCYFTIRLVAGLYQVRQMTRRSHMPERKWIALLQRLQQEMKVQRRIQLLISSDTNSPFTLGWLRPVILLPPSIFTELSADQLEAILIHELAHIKRHDYLLNIIQSIIGVFLFFNPIYWYIANVMEKEREQACDQITLNTLPHPMVYARALTRLAELQAIKFSQNMAVSAIGKQYLHQRIRNIMQYTTHPSINNKQAPLKWYQLITIIACGLLFTILSLDAQGNKQVESSSPQADPGIKVSEEVKDQLILNTKANIAGKVIDAQTGEPLGGVGVMLKDKRAGTITHSDGRFTIQADLDKDTLTFELPGYQTYQTPVHFTSVHIALPRTDYHQLPSSNDDKVRLYIIDKKTARIGGSINRVLYDIKPENIASLEVVSGNARLELLDKFAKDQPDKDQYEVILIWTKEDIEQETKKKTIEKNNLDKIVSQLDENIKKKGHKLNHTLKGNPNTAQPLADSNQHILYIIDGVFIKDNGQKILNELNPQDILSIEIYKGSAAKSYLKDWEEKAYDGAIIVRTKKNEQLHETLNEDNKAFENNFIAFPNQVDEQLYVQFEVAASTHIRIEVVRMNGQSVALLANQAYEPGVNRVTWNTTSQIPGWYIIRALKDGQSFTRKVLVE